MWSRAWSRLFGFPPSPSAPGPASAALDRATPIEAELATTVEWFVNLRWAAVASVLVVVLGAGLVGVVSLSHAPVAATAVVVGLYNLFFDRQARLLARQPFAVAVSTARRLVHAQVLLDLATLTLILYFGGGMESPFIVFYVFHVILASILLSRTASFGYAILGTVLASILAFVNYTGVVPRYALLGPFALGLYDNWPHLAAAVFALACTLFLSAYLTSRIAGRLRARDRELLEMKGKLQEQAAELKETNTKLERLIKSRTAQTLRVAHELRAPLAAIQGLLDVVLQGYTTDPMESQDMLRRARENAADLQELVNDLLHLGHIKEMGPVVSMEPVDLVPIVKDVVRAAESEALLKGVELTVSVADGLPTVKGNREHLRQLVFNLVDNAIKYTNGVGRVTVSLYCDGRHVVGEVSDTGIGIQESDLGRIFDEFYRAENAKRVQRVGTGLGLAIVARIVELHGGQITVQSRPGMGTTFIFTLPVSH